MKRSEFIKFLAVLPAAPALLKGIIPEEEKTNVINEYTSDKHELLKIRSWRKGQTYTTFKEILDYYKQTGCLLYENKTS